MSGVGDADCEPAEASALGANAFGRAHGLVDVLVARFGEGTIGGAEIAAARDEFSAGSGRVFDDDGDVFERRMAAFHEWFVIERPYAGGDPPVVRELRRCSEDSGDDAKATSRALSVLAASHRGLFGVIDVSEREILLEDLIGGARFRVRERRRTAGFEVDDVLETRLMSDGLYVGLGRTFLFHPREAHPEIMAILEADLAKGRSKSEILSQLAGLELRWRRLGNSHAGRVYREALLR